MTFFHHFHECSDHEQNYFVIINDPSIRADLLPCLNPGYIRAAIPIA